jgi:serine/threonine protein kinase
MIIHRDLKLGNLLLGNNLEIKVGDFGLSAKLKFAGERRKSTCGTPNYMAPEQITDLKGHSFEADVWAFGVILYYMLVGCSPFGKNAMTIKDLHKNILNEEFSFPKDNSVSQTA